MGGGVDLRLAREGELAAFSCAGVAPARVMTTSAWVGMRSIMPSYVTFFDRLSESSAAAVTSQCAASATSMMVE